MDRHGVVDPYGLLSTLMRMPFPTCFSDAQEYGFEGHLEQYQGQVDHSTAGAQHAVRIFTELGQPEIGRILAYCIAGHTLPADPAVETRARPIAIITRQRAKSVLVQRFLSNRKYLVPE